MPKVNHYGEDGELTSCGLCHQLSENVREVKVTYHVCNDCKLQDYEVIKKGTQSVHVTKPSEGQAGAAAKVDPATFTPPPRAVPPMIASQFKPEGYVPL